MWTDALWVPCEAHFPRIWALLLQHIHSRMRMLLAGHVNQIALIGHTSVQASTTFGLVVHGTLPIARLLTLAQLLVGRVCVALIEHQIRTPT